MNYTLHCFFVNGVNKLAINEQSSVDRDSALVEVGVEVVGVSARHVLLNARVGVGVAAL